MQGSADGLKAGGGVGVELSRGEVAVAATEVPVEDHLTGLVLIDQLKAVLYRRLTSTVTVWPPGLIVSCEPTLAMPVPVTVIVVLWPASRVPDRWDTATLPSSRDGTEMDQLTGPPFAVRVNEPLDPNVSAMLFVETLSVPSAGADADEPPPLLVDPPVPVPLLVPAVGAVVDADGEAVVVFADVLLVGEPPVPRLDVVAVPVGVDCDALSVRGEGDEVDGDAGGFVVACVVVDGFAWVALCVETILSDGAPACAPVLTTFGDATAAERGPEEASPVVCAVVCPCMTQAVDVAARATVPTAATLNGARARPSRSATCRGKPSGPNEMRRPRTLFQRATGFSSAVIW